MPVISPRRPKALKATGRLDELIGVLLQNPSNGDLLVYNSSSQLWENTQTLSGSYTFSGSLTLTSVTATTINATDLNVADDLTALNAIFTTLAVSGASSLNSLSVASTAAISGAVTIGGALSGAAASFSGNVSVGGTLGVTGATTLAGALSVAGATSIAGTTTLTAPLLGTSAVFSGAVEAGTLSAASVAASVGAFNSLAAQHIDLGRALLTDIAWTLEGTETTDYWQLLNTDTEGTQRTLLKLRSVGLIEGEGDPNGSVSAQTGSLYLRTDGEADNVLYVKMYDTNGDTGWVALRDHASDVDLLLQMYLLLAASVNDIVSQTGAGFPIDL